MCDAQLGVCFPLPPGEDQGEGGGVGLGED